MHNSAFIISKLSRGDMPGYPWPLGHWIAGSQALPLLWPTSSPQLEKSWLLHCIMRKNVANPELKTLKYVHKMHWRRIHIRKKTFQFESNGITRVIKWQLTCSTCLKCIIHLLVNRPIRGAAEKATSTKLQFLANALTFH